MSKRLFNCILFITCLALLFSCVIAPKHLAKAIAKDKPYVAEQTRLLWPCIVTARDTVNTTDTLYDLIEAQCPDIDYTTPEGKTITLPGKTTFLPGQTIYKDRVIYERTKDSAEVYLALNNLEVATNMYKEDTSRLNKTIASQDKKITKKNKRLFWLYVIVASLTLWTVRKPLFRLIKPI